MLRTFLKSSFLISNVYVVFYNKGEAFSPFFHSCYLASQRGFSVGVCVCVCVHIHVQMCVIVSLGVLTSEALCAHATP